MNENSEQKVSSIDTTDSQRPSPGDDVTRYERIVDRAHSEVDYIHRNYRWLLATIVTAITLTVLTGIYWSHQSVSDFKAEIRVEGQKLQSELTRESHDLGERLKTDLHGSLSDEMSSIQSKLDARVKDLGNEVSARVEKEFQSQNISDLIALNAAARVAEIADSLIEREINQKLAPKLTSMEHRLKSLDDEIGKARNTRDDLLVQSEFAMTVTFAQTDNREAFDQLKNWSESPEYPFRIEARDAWEKILDEHGSPFSVSGFTVPWAEGVDPDNLDFARLKRDFTNTPPFVRVALLEYIWMKRADIPKKDKMEFLVHVLKTDRSLKVVEHAGRYFTQESKQKIKPLAVDNLLDWWQKNKGDYDKTQPEEPGDKQ